MDFEEHVRIFNAAVASGDWSTFVATFAEDGVVEFVGPPVGPFVGREAIAAAYEENPPDDAIALNGPVEQDGDEAVAPYRWHATGATGTMRATTRAGKISLLVITFHA
jgi:steroid delta-isomerase